MILQQHHLRHWGHPPSQNQTVQVSEVAEIFESPHRLPAPFARKIYRAGESGMGYCVFTVVFKSGLQQAYVSGNVVDFIPYPPHLGCADVAGVIPHQGRDATTWETPQFKWCLYSDDETELLAQRGMLQPFAAEHLSPWMRLKYFAKRWRNQVLGKGRE